MIYTVTFNPSLDYIVNVENFTLGRVNRTTKELIYPGGKGINVSLVLKNLGYESTALGFRSGFTGAQIEHMLHEWGCKTDFIPVENGISRINLKLRSNEESEINGQGPYIGPDAVGRLFEKLDSIAANDILVLAGSVPGTMKETIYEEILERLSKKGMKAVVDAAGALLVNVLRYQPFLIKPNNHELGEIFHTEIKTKEDILTYGQALQKKGARNVLISMAGDGAALLSEDGGVYFSKAPKGRLVNSVGAGDSMVAGFIAGYLKNQDYKEAFQMGVAAGSASAFSEELATKEEIDSLLTQLEI